MGEGKRSKGTELGAGRGNATFSRHAGETVDVGLE